MHVTNDLKSTNGVPQGNGGAHKKESFDVRGQVIGIRTRLLAKLRTLSRKAHTLLDSLALFDTDPSADLSALETGLAPQTGAIEHHEEERIVTRILAAYGKAKSDQKSVASPYGARGEWDSFIRTGKREYVDALEHCDAEDLSRLLKNFFRNTGADGLLTISSYRQIAAANTRRKRKFVYYLLQDYYNWKDLTGNTSPRPLAVPAAGNAWGYIIHNQLVMPVACRHNYFAHQSRLLLSEVEGCVPIVAEIGGGFGGLAYFLLSSGANCRYVDFDLPEILVVEQYYLMSAFPEKNSFSMGSNQSISVPPWKATT